MWNKDNINNIEFYKRDGTGISHRKLPAVDPDYAKIDDKSFEDLVYFAGQFAELIDYYDINNERDGNWKAFFDNDVTSQLTLISKFDTEQLRNNFEAAKTEFEGSPDKQNLRILFQVIIDSCFLLEKWYSKSVGGLKLNLELEKAVKAGISDHLSLIIAFDKGNILPDGTETTPTPLNCLYRNYSSLWFNEEAFDSWGAYMSSVQPDSSIYEPKEDLDKMSRSVIEISSALYSKVLQGITGIINNSGVFIQESIASWPYHSPHAALYFSFLNIFRYAQDELNAITKKHLEFYFDKVLKFTKKQAVPDSAYLIFELAKNISTHKLEKGTRFKAAKDALGKDVIYSLDEEIVLNKAKVASIKNMYLNGLNFYSGIIGEGDEVVQTEKWKTFGKDQKDLLPSDQTMTRPEIGFAVASPILLLKEGERKITFEISFQPATLAALHLTQNDIKIWLSGEEEWLEAEIDSLTIWGKILIITASLRTEAGAIVPFNNEVLTGGYHTAHPVAKFVFSDNYLPLLKSEIKTFSITVEVSGITNLILQNDLGRLDPKKPFLPFGNLPVSGSNFYIGSYEIFKKQLNSLSLDVTWQDLPYNLSTSKDEHYNAYHTYDKNIVRNNHIFVADVEILYNRSWDKAEKLATGRKLFITEDKIEYVGDRKDNEGGRKDFKFNVFPKKFSRKVDLDEFDELSVDLPQGFMRFKLGKFDFLHRQYPMVYTDAAIYKKALPNEPYTPKIESIKASYSSQIVTDFSTGYKSKDKVEQFFHIYPFGFTEFEPKKNADAPSGILLSNSVLPSFTVKSPVDGLDKDIKGALFIGIKDLSPPRNLSLFFDMVKGSADPDLEKPSLIWSYLSENNWINFTKDEILEDATEKLSQTGILKFQIPSAATSENTRLDLNYHWLRAAVVDSDPANLCQTLNIYCQAAKVTFADNNNDVHYLATPIEAQTISKLVVKDSSVKSVMQPGESFGGKIKEADLDFSIRVSERLRHKNRAVTQWDFERLVLENFENVYKVKCLNHLNENMENAPGYITLVVVPRPGNKDSIDILQPKLSVNARDNIKDAMQKYTSAFVTLAVKNPYYTRIRVMIKVDFRKGYDPGFYMEQLSNDIKKYISPWAYHQDAELIFNNSIHFSGVLNYVEELYYIDHVTNLRMFKTEESVDTETREAKAERPDEILISADEHDILINEC